MTLQDKIIAETKLIAELESNRPEYHSGCGRYSEENKPWELHSVAIRDAYWRRRMLITKLEGGDETVTAQIY